MTTEAAAMHSSMEGIWAPSSHRPTTRTKEHKGQAHCGVGGSHWGGIWLTQFLDKNRAEVSEIAQKLLSGKALGMEICLEYLESLNVVALSCLTYHCNMRCVKESTSGPRCPPLRKGTRGALDLLFTLYTILEGSWKFAQ